MDRSRITQNRRRSSALLVFLAALLPAAPALGLTCGQLLINGSPVPQACVIAAGGGGLTPIAANSLLGNATGAAALPVAVSMPSCSASGSALQWTSSTGVSCNTSIAAASVPATGLTGMPLCSGAGSALEWNGTTFACNSSITAAAAPATGLTGMPSCSGPGNALGWNGTTFACNGSIAAASVPAAGVSGTLAASNMPAPTASTLGGVESASAGANQFMTGINTSGVLQFAQPAVTNLSGFGTGVASALGNAANGANGVAQLNGSSILLSAYLPTNVAYLTVADQVQSGGVTLTPYSIGTESSGTYTVDCGKNPVQYLLNGGAFTIAAPANDGNCLVQVQNGASAGAITLSGFSSSPSGSGDTFATANTASGTVTISIASPTVITWTQTFVPGQAVYFTTSGALPTGITANTIYYVISAGLSGSQFEISATPGGSAINTSGSQSGTQTGHEPSVFMLDVIRINGLATAIWKQQQ